MKHAQSKSNQRSACKCTSNFSNSSNLKSIWSNLHSSQTSSSATEDFRLIQGCRTKFRITAKLLRRWESRPSIFVMAFASVRASDKLSSSNLDSNWLWSRVFTWRKEDIFVFWLWSQKPTGLSVHLLGGFGSGNITAAQTHAFPMNADKISIEPRQL